MRIYRIGMVVLLATIMGACARVTNYLAPTPEEMRGALVTMLKERPDISIPEFETSLQYETPKVHDGNVYIGSWVCDPELQTFLTVFSGGSTSMYEVSGRFECTPAGTWVAIPWRPKMVHSQDIHGYWRASNVDTHWESD